MSIKNTTETPKPNEMLQIAARSLDFDHEQTENTTSWKKAHGLKDDMEKVDTRTVAVKRHGADTIHLCTLVTDREEYYGRCTCDGFHHNEGPCTHLCSIRQAAFVGRLELPDSNALLSRSRSEQAQENHRE